MRTASRAGLFALLGTLPLAALALPTYSEVRAAYVASDATLLARDGRPLHTLRLDKNGRREAWTALDDIAPAFIRAVIVSEDKRFLEHDGVDWQAAGKAAWTNFWGGRVVTNGMSQYSRAERNANAALVVNVNPEDFPGDFKTNPLAGIDFQRQCASAASCRRRSTASRSPNSLP